MPEAGESGSPTIRLPHSPRRTFRLIQVLRAVAALMVVAHHATMLMEQRASVFGRTWENGASGVDVFFVISGLVMTLSTARLRQGWAAASEFLKRRVERVVPLYWLAITAKVVLTVALPTLALHTNGTGWHVVASYLFLPSVGPAGTLEPTLVVGWTLNLEMLFYVLIAGGLLLRVPAWWVVVPSLATLVVLAATRAVPGVPLRAWGDPAVLEFVWGMVLGAMVLRGKMLPRITAAALAVCGFAALLATPSMIISVWRPVVWGLPAMAIVAGALALESEWGAKTPGVLLLLGDASYSIYLTHGFVLPVLSMGRIGVRLVSPGMPLTLSVLGMLLSSAVGVACYRAVELPILEWFRLRRGGLTQSGAQGGGGRRSAPEQ